MKYVTILLSILLFLGYSFFMGDFSFTLNKLLVILVYALFFLWEYSVLQKSFEADFKIRSYKKVIGVFSIGLAVCVTLFLIYSSDYKIQKNDFFFVILFWLEPIILVQMYFIYKKENPFTILIKGDELILNQRRLQTRNLKHLIRIDKSTFTRELKLNFKGKSEVCIPIKEYNQTDFQEFLNILVEKSGHTVSIPKKIF